MGSKLVNFLHPTRPRLDSNPLTASGPPNTVIVRTHKFYSQGSSLDLKGISPEFHLYYSGDGGTHIEDSQGHSCESGVVGTHIEDSSQGPLLPQERPQAP